MSENRVEGPAHWIRSHTGRHPLLERQISLREPGKWSEWLISENRVEGLAYRVDGAAWNTGNRGGNNDCAAEDGRQAEPEAAVSRWKARGNRAARRREAARRGVGSALGPREPVWVPPLSPVTAIRVIGEDGEFFILPSQLP